MHRILMRTIVLDFPSDVHDQALDFWRVALAADLRRGHTHPEYHVLDHAAALGPVLVQKLGEGASRIHLDIESDDTEAEVARLLAAGAVEVRRLDDWVVLRDPGGLLFCVVPGNADDERFAQSAHTVGT
jgi:catechol 2,3-dioxygenase-like lactoylglutathione lyase family enzyme